MVGLAIAIGVPIQIIFGYKHHINYVKYGERTTSSLIHIYLGRTLFVALNGNVFLGLLHGRKSSAIRLLWAAIVLIEMLVLGTMIFSKRSNKGKDYGHMKVEEFDPFVIGDEEEKSRDSNSFDAGPSNSSQYLTRRPS